MGRSEGDVVQHDAQARTPRLHAQSDHRGTDEKPPLFETADSEDEATGEEEHPPRLPHHKEGPEEESPIADALLHAFFFRTLWKAQSNLYGVVIRIIRQKR